MLGPHLFYSDIQRPETTVPGERGVANHDPQLPTRLTHIKEAFARLTEDPADSGLKDVVQWRSEKLELPSTRRACLRRS